MVCMFILTNLPYVLHKVNMLLLYYMMLFVPKSSTFFSMSYDCVTVIYDVTSHSSPNSKIKKSKIKTKNKIK